MKFVSFLQEVAAKLFSSDLECRRPAIWVIFITLCHNCSFVYDGFRFAGEAFYSFHSTVSACLTTTLILLISYIFSARTFGLMRQSIFVSSRSWRVHLIDESFLHFRKFSSIHLPAFYTLARGYHEDYFHLRSINWRFINSFQFLHGICNKRLAISTLHILVEWYGISGNDMRLCEFLCLLEWTISLFLSLNDDLFLVRRFDLSHSLWNGCICCLQRLQRIFLRDAVY